MSYKIVRLFANGRKYTIYRGMSLEEVQAHCSDPETNSDTCRKPANRRRTREHGDWFDGYYKE
jgi:hypothetical protein